MSTPKRIITLSIGSQTVSLAEFRAGKTRGSLNLHAMESRALMADPAADATRVSQAALLLGEMVGALKARNQPVRVTLPAQSTFSRMVKVPAMGGTQLKETVVHEAKQNIPYPLEEVVWDYRVVFETEEHDPEVLIAAAKTDILQDWTTVIQASDLTPSGLELANAALYNAFRYNYGEPAGCSLLIDLGARTTNLIFVEPGKFFIRTISSGGSSLTAAVAKEFGESFFQAENRKVQSGFVGLGANFAEPEDPEQAKLAKVLRNAATRLHAEVARSVSFYRSQQAGGAPQRVFLCGGGCAVPMMREFWAEKMGVPTEIFDALRCIGLSSGAAQPAAGARASLGEHVGLALQTALDCPVSINLLPPALKRKKVIGQYALVIGLAAACLCAPAISWSLHLKKTAQEATKQADNLVKEIEESKNWDKQMKSLRDSIAGTLAQATPLQQAATDRQYWVALLESLHACLPKELVWITSMDLVKPAPVTANSAAAPTVGAQSPALPPGTVRLMLKGFYLENPKGVEVVDELGLALTYKAAINAALVEAAHAGKKLSEEEIAEVKKVELEKIKKECEGFRWNEDSIEAFTDRLKAQAPSSAPTVFQVAPIQDWVRPNTPSSTDWAQEFAIPLDLVSPPVSFARPTP